MAASFPFDVLFDLGLKGGIDRCFLLRGFSMVASILFSACSALLRGVMLNFGTFGVMGVCDLFRKNGIVGVLWAGEHPKL